MHANLPNHLVYKEKFIFMTIQNHREMHCDERSKTDKVQCSRSSLLVMNPKWNNASENAYRAQCFLDNKKCIPYNQWDYAKYWFQAQNCKCFPQLQSKTSPATDSGQVLVKATMNCLGHESFFMVILHPVGYNLFLPNHNIDMYEFHRASKYEYYKPMNKTKEQSVACMWVRDNVIL